MSTKAKFLISTRILRDSYFQVTKLMPVMDRDQSYVINKALTLGLMVLGEDPQRMTPDDATRKVLATQGAVIRDLTARLEPVDREPAEVKA